jgi:integrase/recombinase XerD
MRELLTGQHSEAAQAQQPLESAIASFCSGFKKPNTRAAYEGDLRAFSRFATRSGVSQLGELTQELIDGYFQDCESKGLSTTTIRRQTASLKGLLKWEGMEELSRETTSLDYKRVGNAEELKPLHPLSKEEVDRLQEISQNNLRASAIIAIALQTGATPEQIRALNASDVLEQENQGMAIRFRGKRSERQVTLDTSASEIVRRHKGDREGEEPLFAQKPPIKRGEERLTRQGIWKNVKQYGEMIGRPDLNPRILHQTFIANAQTNDSKELARLLDFNVVYASRILLQRRRLSEKLPQGGVLFEATAK